MTPRRCRALKKACRASARARQARARAHARQRHREHGYFFFRRWALHAIPFTKGIRRLGENMAAFLALAAAAERWLRSGVGGQQPEAGEPQAADGQDASFPQDSPIGDVQSAIPQSPSPGPQALTTAQRLSLATAKIGRALAQVLWLRPRVIRERVRRTSVVLEARLRLLGELQGGLQGAEGPEVQAELAAKVGRIFGPTYEEYKYAKVWDADPDRHVVHRFAAWVTELVAETVSDGWERGGQELGCLRLRLKWLAEAFQAAIDLLSPRATETAPPSPGSSPAGRAARRLRAQRKMLQRVESSSAESLGNPFPSSARVAQALEGRRPKTRRRRKPASPQTPSGTTPQTPSGAASAGSSSAESAATAPPLPLVEYDKWGRPLPGAGRYSFHWPLGPVVEFGEKVGNKVKRYFGLTAESLLTARFEAWPLARELELRAEAEARRRAANGGPAEGGGERRQEASIIAYGELQRLLAQALGLAPAAAAHPQPLCPGKRRAQERRALERTARCLWVLLAWQTRWAEREAARLEGLFAEPEPERAADRPRLLADRLAALERDDLEAGFACQERWARLEAALHQLLVTLHGPQPDFEPLRPDPLWFDAGRKQLLRQALGLDPLPAEPMHPAPAGMTTRKLSRQLDRIVDEMNAAEWLAEGRKKEAMFEELKAAAHQPPLDWRKILARQRGARNARVPRKFR